MNPNARPPAPTQSAGGPDQLAAKLADTLKRTPPTPPVGRIPRHGYCPHTTVERYVVISWHASGDAWAFEFDAWPAAAAWFDYVGQTLSALPHNVPGIDPVHQWQVRKLVGDQWVPVHYPWHQDGTPNLNGAPNLKQLAA